MVRFNLVLSFHSYISLIVIQEVGRLSLVLGPLTEDPDGEDSPYGSNAYLEPSFKYHYIFHASYSDVDKAWNAPGVFPGYDAFLTSDIFPFICHRYAVSVGPLLAKSRAEYVFLSTAKGDKDRGIETQIGLLRVSRLSLMKTYGRNRINPPLYGDIKRGDLSLWKQCHRPPVEEYVRLRFPDDYAHPPALLYDFKVNRIVSCIPTLVALMTGPIPSVPILPDIHGSAPLSGNGERLPPTLAVESTTSTHGPSPTCPPSISEEGNAESSADSATHRQSSTSIVSDDHRSETRGRDHAASGRSSQSVSGAPSVVEINIARPIRPLPLRHRRDTSSAHSINFASLTSMTLILSSRVPL